MQRDRGSKRAGDNGAIRKGTQAVVAVIAAVGIVLSGGIAAQAQQGAPIEPPALTAAAPAAAGSVAETASADTSAAAAVAPTSLAGFNASNLMSDTIFYDGNAMSAAQIQSFLDQKIGTCTNGKCINIAKASFSSRGAVISARTGNQVCAPLTGGTMSVAEAIFRVQRACGISAKVILVTLQKEQGLVTSRAPSDWNIRSAMGAFCPDTAPCDPSYAGIGPQLVSGTTQLKTYKAGAFARQPGVHSIGYHPNAGCGGTNLVLANYATAALYNYTPYQPNAAALRAGYGTGDGCSSYGNRNFYNYYTDWFGSTQAPVCAQPNATAAKYAYVVTADVLNARVGPNTDCATGAVQLTAGTILQALAVHDDWLKVQLETSTRWVHRDFLRRADSAETACTVRGGVTSAVRVYTLTEATVARRNSRGHCDVGSQPLASGTVVQAIGINSSRTWLKVRAGATDLWVPRAATRVATSGELSCVLPAGISPASKAYVLGAATTARLSPSASCGSGSVQLPAGTIVQAVQTNDARTWLKVSVGTADLWIDRSVTRSASSTEAECALPSGTSTAKRVYVVDVASANARLAPTRACTMNAAPLALGTALTAQEVSADRLWVRATAGGVQRWVLRESLAIQTPADRCETVPSSAASLSYVLLESATGRQAPGIGCSTGSVTVPAGAMVDASAVTPAGDWLQVSHNGSLVWVQRDSTRKATAEESCVAPTGTAAAVQRYTVGSAGATARIAPRTGCTTGATTLPPGGTLQATLVTADRLWLQLTVDGSSVWVKRSEVTRAP